MNLTAIVFLATDPRKVRGGDLVLAYEGEEATIRFRHNRLVIFPSRTLHRVTPVRVASTDPRDARVSLQCWLTYGRTEAKPEPRRAEADLPTFLLAEESIVAAAQAMSSAAAADQTPEDVYWGAFYLSRILSSNLRCLLSEHADLANGRLRIRRAPGGDLEVYVRARAAAGRAPVRVGFLLSGPSTPPAQALSLFVETGRGQAKSMSRRIVPPGASERETRTIFRRLLARAQH